MKTLDDSNIPILPYTRHKGKAGRYRPWEYEYDPAKDEYCCPNGGILRHTTIDRNGKRTYRSIPKECVNCPGWGKCGANAKEKHGMRYTHHRGLARVASWVKLKFAAMNLKKLAIWSWKSIFPYSFFIFSIRFCRRTPVFVY